MPQNCPLKTLCPVAASPGKKGHQPPTPCPLVPCLLEGRPCCSPCQQNGSHQEPCPSSPHFHGSCNGLWAPRPHASNCKRIWHWLSGFILVNVGLIKLEFPNSIKDRFKSCWTAKKRGNCFTQPLANLEGQGTPPTNAKCIVNDNKILCRGQLSSPMQAEMTPLPEMGITQNSHSSGWV